MPEKWLAITRGINFKTLLYSNSFVCFSFRNNRVGVKILILKTLSRLEPLYQDHSVIIESITDSGKLYHRLYVATIVYPGYYLWCINLCLDGS